MSEQIDEASGTLLPSPEADVAAADAAVTGIWREPFDSLLGPPLGAGSVFFHLIFSFVPHTQLHSEGEALEDELRRQLEYFLSPEYLATDPDLVSQMNSDMSFPITTVATLTTFKVDMDVLLKSISKSSSLTISDDGTKVTPNFKIQRNTIILRDIPSSTKVEVPALIQHRSMWDYRFEITKLGGAKHLPGRKLSRCDRHPARY